MSHKKAVKSIRIKESILTSIIMIAVIITGCSTLASAVFGKRVPVATTTTQPVQDAPVVSQYDPTTKDWSYDFSNRADGVVSPKDWHFELGPETANYHNELQTYTADTSNARIQDGALIIEARKQILDGKQYTSARLSTLGNFSFTYGTLEVEMMLPEGNGTWPAAWLMPRNNIYTPSALGVAKDDKLAWAVNGEIDFAESIGSLPGQNLPTIHSYYELQRKPTYSPAFVKNQYTQFHRYGVIKTPTKITFTLDGAPYASREKTADSPLEWPYDQPYYLILNLAIGGDWAGANGIDDVSAPWQLKVKSITYKAP